MDLFKVFLPNGNALHIFAMLEWLSSALTILYETAQYYTGDVNVLQTTKVKKWGDAEVSRLGFGCMRLPLQADGSIDREKAFEMIDTAYRGGVNYFDTAYGYHKGESELFLGEALKKYPRDKVYVATKLPIPHVKNPEHTVEILEEQLKKTQLDYIDNYMLHGINGSQISKMKELGIYETLTEKKRQGVIRRLGFSYHGDYDSLCELVDNYEWDFVQIQINYLDFIMLDAQALYDKLCEKEIPIIVMEPVRGGFLANPPDDVKKVMSSFEEGKINPAGWALRWCAGMANMPVILSGMSTMEQVTENLETFSTAEPLTDEQNKMLAKCRDIIMNTKSIPCTGCRYCMDCPFGVDIPKAFSIYNEYELFKNAFRANNNYRMLRESGHSAELCEACGVCVPQCPQNIQIPDEMPKIHETLLALAEQFK